MPAEWAFHYQAIRMLSIQKKFFMFLYFGYALQKYLKHKQTNPAPRFAKIHKNKVITVKNKLKKRK